MATVRQTFTKGGQMGRTFAVIGAVYAGSECVIEKVISLPGMPSRTKSCAGGAIGDNLGSF